MVYIQLSFRCSNTGRGKIWKVLKWVKRTGCYVDWINRKEGRLLDTTQRKGNSIQMQGRGQEKRQRIIAYIPHRLYINWEKTLRQLEFNRKKELTEEEIHLYECQEFSNNQFNCETAFTAS